MSKQEEDAFRVAFDVFAVSTLLSPSAKHDYASIDYWNALEDPSSISKYDWSEFVMTRLLDAVTKLKQDVSSSIKSPIITGCSLFLQVLYLDSIDPDVLSMKHNSFPRIRDFSYDRMRLMIAAEQNCARGNDNTRDCKIRDAVDCRYHWAAQPERDGSRSGCLLAIWESSVAMAHLLKIPMEAAGSLFIAAADFQDQINSGLRVSEPIEFMSVLVSIMLPYTNGFNYQFSIDDDDNKAAEAGLAKFPSTLSNGL